MFPETTELLLIGYSHRINMDLQNPNQISLTPRNQFADILTKGNFTRDDWNHLLFLFNISHFSSINCSEVMSNRTQEDASEERITAKFKVDDAFGLAIQRKGSKRACLDCIRKPGENHT